MKKEFDFFKCELCGNIVVKLVDSGVNLSCCGQEMKKLEAGEIEASAEKHLPSFIEEGKETKIQVGSVLHPTLEEHYIQFILGSGEDIAVLKLLKPGEEPSMKLDVSKIDTAYEYCNLHGLWKSEK